MIKSIFFVLSLLFLSPASAQEMEDNVAITFFPVYAKAERLVAIELITSAKYKSRYLALERSVMQNDWRPLLPGSDGINPGKCTIYTAERGFLIECWLVSASPKKRAHALKAVVTTVEEVIATVVNFSKNR